MIQHVSETPSTETLGRLISGFGERDTSLHRDPVTDCGEMARQCRVTFRPLPERRVSEAVRRLRDDLARELQRSGVCVIPWQEACVEFQQSLTVPIIGRAFRYTTRGVRSGINAVIDVERPSSAAQRAGVGLVESLYWVSSLCRPKLSLRSVTSIARLSLWADDHAAKYIQDPLRTQIVTLTDVDERLVSGDMPYSQRIRLGLTALARSFSHIVVGANGSKVTIVNMNLTDSAVDRTELETFVRTCLIPKLFVPVSPLLPGQFEVGRYDPHAAESAHKLIALSHGLRTTGLLPSGEQIRALLKRKSHRDIAKVITDGRTGVSFGFLAYVEPPHYVGPRRISSSEWDNLTSIGVYRDDEVRRGKQGRLYARIRGKAGLFYRQIPDLWIASSRSGSDKTRLRLDRDVIRVGYDGGFRIQLPHGLSSNGDLCPSYDIRVMVALALATALYAPEMIQDGLALFHFHGYPRRDWFGPKEAFGGVDNPAVPCGTSEAGVLNFQTMAQLVSTYGPDLDLACVIEPDHGTNLVAPNVQYLIERVQQGAKRGQLMLGGQSLPSLKQAQRENIEATR